MIQRKCSVVINTCDKYEVAWYPFFELAKKYWSECPYPFYLNTECKGFSYAGLDVKVINYEITSLPANTPWGKRLKSCLKVIPSDYVILLLEDFFFQSPVNDAEIARCIKKMEEHPEISAIYFKQIYGYHQVYEEDPAYFIMRESQSYKCNLQAGLWRKSDLMAFVEDDDSPWSLEQEGANRTGDKVFLCSRKGTHSKTEGCVFPYLTERRKGYGIWAGKWLWNNDGLFRKNGIEVKNVDLPRFTRYDMAKYYLDRIVQEIKKNINCKKE